MGATPAVADPGPRSALPAFVPELRYGVEVTGPVFELNMTGCHSGRFAWSSTLSIDTRRALVDVE